MPRLRADTRRGNHRGTEEIVTGSIAEGKCHICGGALFLDSCQRCAERAANEPAFAGTPDGQWALAANARVCAIARRAAKGELRVAWGDR